MSSKTTSIYFGEVSGKELEWGEIYHAAAFLAADPAHQIFLVTAKEKDWIEVIKFLRKFTSSPQKVLVINSLSEAKARASGMAASAKRFSYLAKNRCDLHTMIRNRFQNVLELTEADCAARADQPNRCLLWIRSKDNKTCWRNLNEYGFDQICGLLKNLNVEPILIGDQALFAKPTSDSLIEFWKQDGLDGLCFADCLPTFFIEKSGKNTGKPDDRMKNLTDAFPSSFKWVKALFSGQNNRVKFDGFSCENLRDLRNSIGMNISQHEPPRGKLNSVG